MGFTNPVTDVTVDGGSITSVGSSAIGAAVPYNGVDALYWPQINGQAFPPTLGSTALYTSTPDGQPAISSGGGGSATFPILPRRVGTKTTLTVTAALYLQNPAVPPSANPVLGFGDGWGIALDTNGQLVVWHNGLTPAVLNPDPAPGWHTGIITVAAADGTITLAADAGEPVAYPAGSFTGAAQPTANVNGVTGDQIALGPLYAQWS